MRIKLVLLATIALVLNLMTISPAKAEVILSAGKPPMAKITNINCTQKLCQSFKFVEEMAPMFMNVGTNITSNILFRQDLGDRLFNLNEKAGIGCLVDGQGSVNGTITCGIVDKF